MSDRVSGFKVVLREPMKDEEAEPLRRAIECFENVSAVTANVRRVGNVLEYMRAKRELIEKMLEVYRTLD